MAILSLVVVSGLTYVVYCDKLLSMCNLLFRICCQLVIGIPIIMPNTCACTVNRDIFGLHIMLFIKYSRKYIHCENAT